MRHTCGGVVKKFCSWTPENPGRMFEKCWEAKEVRCSYFEWLEPEISDETKGLINDLRKDEQLSVAKKLVVRHLLTQIWALEAELLAVKSKNEELISQVGFYDELIGGKFDINDGVDDSSEC